MLKEFGCKQIEEGISLLIATSNAKSDKGWREIYTFDLAIYTRRIQLGQCLWLCVRFRSLIGPSVT